MKLTAIRVENFLGARDVDAQLTAPVALFAGPNGAGKSSIQEAVRMALTGESARVPLKKGYALLVSEGEKTGCIAVTVEGGGTFSVALPAGSGQHMAGSTLPYVLDAQRFATLDASARRAFLFGLMGLSADGTAIRQRLLDKGCAPARVETIAPILRAGFEAACKEAQSRARDAKTAWRTITGEAYGHQKAETWCAHGHNPDNPQAQLSDTGERLTAANERLARANEHIGALKAGRKRHDETARRLAELREKGGRYARIADKLARDEAQFKAWQVKVDEARQQAGGGRWVGLVHDLAWSLNEVLRMVIPFGEMNGGQRQQLQEADAALARYETEHGSIESAAAPDTDARDKLPEYEKALRLLQNAVDNDRRDLAEADAAAKAITELETALGTAPDEGELEAAQTELAQAAREQQTLAVSRDQLLEKQRQAKQAQERTGRARAAHADAQAWTAIAEALAPDGIPGEMLAQALGPINERLEDSAQTSGWLAAHISPDMSICAAQPENGNWPPGNVPHDYALLSESERWRVDAMLAEAISFFSKARLLVLDRFDVLDLPARAELVTWLDALARRNAIDTALIFGTLKQPPAHLPANVQTFWLEAGTVQAGR